MHKCVALLKCKPGLSREAFIDYYENQHQSLIRSLLPQICGYRRNFIHPEGAYISEAAAERDFDVITELWFADRFAYDEAMALSAQPDISRRIAEDEENFLDRAYTRMFVVEEHGSDFS